MRSAQCTRRNGRNAHLPNLVQRISIHVVHVALDNFQTVTRSEPLKVLVPGQVEVYLVLNTKRARCLERPCARDVLDGVPAAAQKHEGDVLLADVLHTACVPLHREVETAEFVPRERVGAALEHDGGGLEDVDDLVDDLPSAQASA